jgi:hypothetical protein
MNRASTASIPFKNPARGCSASTTHSSQNIVFEYEIYESDAVSRVTINALSVQQANGYNKAMMSELMIRGSAFLKERQLILREEKKKREEVGPETFARFLFFLFYKTRVHSGPSHKT